MNYNLIVENWRKFLLLENINDNINRMINKVILHNENCYEENRIKIILDNSEDEIKIYFADNDDFKNLDEPFVGSITLNSANSKLEEDLYQSIHTKGEGEINPSWIVSGSRSSDNVGPLLYEIALEWITNIRNSSVKPDHVDVSDDALRVWEIYMSRPDIQHIQLDIAEPETYPEFNIQQLTPSFEEDDTDQYSAVSRKGEYWYESCLSKAYKKDNMSTIERLEELNLIKIYNF